MPRAQELNVTGDLQVLSNLTKLKEIFLDKTQVHSLKMRFATSGNYG